MGLLKDIATDRDIDDIINGVFKESMGNDAGTSDKDIDDIIEGTYAEYEDDRMSEMEAEKITGYLLGKGC